jgi:L,D-transpeptidase catalytic domain/Putative peptidoglycan binding domain
MGKIASMLLGMVMTTGVLIGLSATEPLAVEAEAANYVSRLYTAPKKGQTGNHIVALQRRLRAAGVMPTEHITGYFGDRTESAVKRFQRSVGLEPVGKVGKRTWDLLVAKTGKILIKKPFKWPPKNSVNLPSRCETSGRVLCVDKSKRKLYYVKAGKIIKTADARFGCPGMRTREGTFKVRWKSRHHVSSLFNSPMPYAMFFSGGQAVHYSPDFARVGYNGCSHGCVNIRSRSTIAWIFDQIRVGDRVYVYWS